MAYHMGANWRHIRLLIVGATGQRRTSSSTVRRRHLRPHAEQVHDGRRNIDVAPRAEIVLFSIIGPAAMKVALISFNWAS